MGIAEQKLEILFVSPDEHGHGIGCVLIEHAIKEYAVSKVAVNEQNPQTRVFYGRMGFVVYKRTEVDEQGRHILSCTYIIDGRNYRESLVKYQ